MRLEFSSDHGSTWRLVVAPCGGSGVDACGAGAATSDPTLYFASTTSLWRRVIVPLTGLQICGWVHM